MEKWYWWQFHWFRWLQHFVFGCFHFILKKVVCSRHFSYRKYHRRLKRLLSWKCFWLKLVKLDWSFSVLIYLFSSALNRGSARLIGAFGASSSCLKIRICVSWLKVGITCSRVSGLGSADFCSGAKLVCAFWESSWKKLSNDGILNKEHRTVKSWLIARSAEASGCGWGGIEGSCSISSSSTSCVSEGGGENRVSQK